MADSIKMLLLIISGTVLWGIGNVLKKRYLDKNVDANVMVIGTMMGAATVAAAVEIAWNGIPKISGEFWLPFAITAVLNIAMAHLNVRALQREDASIVTSLASTMPAWAIAASWIILQEKPTLLQHIGILLIACGAYVLGLKGGAAVLPPFLAAIIPEHFHKKFEFFTGPWLRLMYSRGAWYAVIQAWLGAVAINFDKVATLSSSPMVFTGGAYFVVALSTYMWVVSRGQRVRGDKKLFVPILLLGGLIGIYTILLNAGYYFDLAVNIGSLKRMQIVWTAIFAAILLHERHSALRITGAAIIFAGAFLIAL